MPSTDELTDHLLEWDDEITAEPTPSYTLLEPGDYPFTVTGFDRARHEGSDKLPPCNKAVVSCLVDGGPQGKTTIKSNLFLHSKCEGLLSAFFTSIGLKKHGEPLRMNWPATVGKSGCCRIEKVVGKKDPSKMYNQIDRFLDPSENTPVVPF